MNLREGWVIYFIILLCVYGNILKNVFVFYNLFFEFIIIVFFGNILTIEIITPSKKMDSDLLNFLRYSTKIDFLKS